MKIFTLPDGRKLGIAKYKQAARDGVVIFSEREWKWFQQFAPSFEEIMVAYNLKKDELFFCPINEPELPKNHNHAAEMAFRIGGEIIETLKRGKSESI